MTSLTLIKSLHKTTLLYLSVIGVFYISLLLAMRFNEDEHVIFSRQISHMYSNTYKLDILLL